MSVLTKPKATFPVTSARSAYMSVAVEVEDRRRREELYNHRVKSLREGFESLLIRIRAKHSPRDQRLTEVVAVARNVGGGGLVQDAALLPLCACPEATNRALLFLAKVRRR